jgi:hypothetical protein
VIRNISALLSAAIIGAGIWLLTRVHDVVNSCSNNSNALQVGIKSKCENDVSFYFLGFAFIVLGVVTLSLSLFAMKKRRNLVGASSGITDTNALDERYRHTDFHDRERP